MDAASTSRDGDAWLRRLAAAAVALLALGWLAAGTQLEPAAQLSPHEQLGLPQCSLAASWQRPCPTCGMTTAFALATQGRLIAAAMMQPAGAAFALALAVTVWVAGFVAVTGTPLTPLWRWLGRRWRGVSVGVAVVLAAGWLTRLIGG